MDFDGILVKYVGCLGKFQIIHSLAIGLIMILTSFHAISLTFTGLTVPHR